ncbi:MAG TPA: GNAT family N-acetyltransferase, partial [Steroidobacteraceae bacterium]|nr:GNAT family N-acetyltransferase [Steroidobacteraceae bacterium]
MTTTKTSAVIRRATPSDASALAALGAATFSETFGHLYPPEDLQTFLTTHSVAAWDSVLRDQRSAVWTAELNDDAQVGFIVVGPCKLPVENCEPTAGEIKQLYVLARHHNLRLGARLMELALEWLAEQDRSPIYIGVWSENYGAQRFYARYGFSKVGEYGFRVGNT